ncbi:hypothetical protein HY448_00670 [Candidatus Pacearchaeota archaeon]|nr:hypothetical protein [Candidatus Pacearchaeota archaeon]
MAPIIEVSDSVMEDLERMGVPYKLHQSKSVDLERDYVQLPSGLYVARQRTLLGKSWNEAHAGLKMQKSRMPTPIEFVEFLNYVRKNNPKLYNEVTQVRSPWRAEWIDALFEKREDGMYILTENKTKAEKLDDDTLMEDRTPGISLDSWLNNHTSQGLPRKNVEKGDLYFWAPENGSVARFYAGSDEADLNCYGGPFDWGSNLGVRAVLEG